MSVRAQTRLLQRLASTDLHPSREALPPRPHLVPPVPEPAKVQVTSCLLSRRSVHPTLLCCAPRCPSPGDKSLVLLASLR